MPVLRTGDELLDEFEILRELREVPDFDEREKTLLLREDDADDRLPLLLRIDDELERRNGDEDRLLLRMPLLRLLLRMPLLRLLLRMPLLRLLLRLPELRLTELLPPERPRELPPREAPPDRPKDFCASAGTASRANPSIDSPSINQRNFVISNPLSSSTGQ